MSAGSFDGDPPLKLAAHIYTDEAGRYYDIGRFAAGFDSEASRQGGWEKLRR